MNNRRRNLRRFLAALAVSALGVCLFGGCASLGRGATGARLQRVQASSHFHDGVFVNPQPIVNDLWKSMGTLFGSSADTSPPEPLDFSVDVARLSQATPSDLRVTWFGHSSTLVELGGRRVLTDPIWSDRASPIGWVGPSRFSSARQTLEALPRIDVVVVSHNHYDHLDYRTIQRLVPLGATFIVPLGVGDTLLSWGVPEARVVELDWWQRHIVDAELEIVSVPARHASGRTVVDTNESFWAGYALLGRKARVYYSGDTGLFPALREIGDRLGPFDLTLIESGQYGAGWPDWHVGPEQAVRAHQMVRGKLMLPVHWGAFALAGHGWTEPIERVLLAAQAANVEVVTPRLGQTFEPSHELPRERWWPALPFQTAREAPIVSRLVDPEPPPSKPNGTQAKPPPHRGP